MGDPTEEVRALGHLVGEAVAGLARAVQTSHGQVSGAVDAVLPRRLRPWRPLSSATVAGVYATVAVGARVVPVAAAEVAALVGRAEALAPSRSRPGRAFLSTVNGLWPQLVDRHPPLVIEMAVRVGEDDVHLTASGIRDAFPQATGRLVVFLHGMVTDEASWHRPPASAGVPTEDLGPGPTASGEAPSGYADRLRADVNATAVFVRYHSGRSVEGNGRRLAELLDALGRLWPTSVDEVHIVGHSMGGLVAVAAVRHATLEAMSWARRTGRVVTLGAPHHGAPLARAVREVTARLAQVAVIGPGVQAIHSQAEGWTDLCEAPGARPPVPGAALQVVTVGASRFGMSGHPLLDQIGDGVVPTSSAEAHRAVAFTPDRRRIDGAWHMQLLNHPQVYGHLVTLLAGDAPG